MRLLLDENLDWRLERHLPGHVVKSVPRIGWAGIGNGELLKKASEGGFNALITMDTNMTHQQDVSACKIAVIALKARSNRLADTLPLMPQLLELLPRLKFGVSPIFPISEQPQAARVVGCNKSSGFEGSLEGKSYPDGLCSRTTLGNVIHRKEEKT